jgi:uncharacterized protein
MKIFVKAKTKAKVESIEKISEANYKVSVKATPVAGKANIAIVKALAKYFDINCSAITLVSGQTSRQKVFMIK